MKMKRKTIWLLIWLLAGIFGDVSNGALVETWSGPPGYQDPYPFGYIGTFTSNDGNPWTFVGSGAGLPTGRPILNGDLILSDPVSEADGGESTMIMFNLMFEPDPAPVFTPGDVFSDLIATTTINHDEHNGAGILARGGLDLDHGWGYSLVIDGETGQLLCKKINIDIDILSASTITDYDPANTYEMVFTLVGDTLTGKVNLDGSEVASLVATDNTYASGITGVLGTTTVGQQYPPPQSTHPLSVTFGDLTVIPEPATIALLGLGALALLRKRRM